MDICTFIVTFICRCNISTCGSAVRIFEIGLVISVDIYCIVLDVGMHYNVREVREEGEIVRPIRQSESV